MKLAALALCSLAVTSAGQEPVILRTELRAEGEVWVGARTSIYVTVSMDARPDHTPRFEVPSLDGALLFRAPGSPLLGSERVSGREYTSQRFELMLFPQRAGELRVPEIPVRVSLAGEEHRLSTEAVSIVAEAPPGLPPGAHPIASPELSIEAVFEPRPEGARVGDAFRRTITIRARDVMGLAIPPAPIPAIPGLAAYPGEPSVEDRLSRGALTTTRVDTVTLVCEAPGHVELPALVYRWWNPQAARVEEQALDGLSFEVAPAPPVEVEGPLAAERRGPWPWFAGALAFALLLAASSRQVLRGWRARREGSEGGRYRRLIAACRAGRAADAWSALWTWLERVAPGVRSLEELEPTSRRPELADATEALQRALLDPSRDWSGAELIAVLARVRHALHARDASAARLGPLNPSA